MEQLKAQLEKSLRSEYQSLKGALDTHELTPDDIAALRVALSNEMKRLGLSPVDFGKLASNIIYVVGLEKILDGIERAGQ